MSFAKSTFKPLPCTASNLEASNGAQRAPDDYLIASATGAADITPPALTGRVAA